jgi:hypothetical protein
MTHTPKYQALKHKGNANPFIVKAILKQCVAEHLFVLEVHTSL